MMQLENEKVFRLARNCAPLALCGFALNLPASHRTIVFLRRCRQELWELLSVHRLRLSS